MESLRSSVTNYISEQVHSEAIEISELIEKIDSMISNSKHMQDESKTLLHDKSSELYNELFNITEDTLEYHENNREQ